MCMVSRFFLSILAPTDRKQWYQYTCMAWNYFFSTEIYSYSAGSQAGTLWWIWKAPLLASESDINRSSQLVSDIQKMLPMFATCTCHEAGLYPQTANHHKCPLFTSLVKNVHVSHRWCCCSTLWDFQSGKWKSSSPPIRRSWSGLQPSRSAFEGRPQGEIGWLLECCCMLLRRSHFKLFKVDGTGLSATALWRFPLETLLVR